MLKVEENIRKGLFDVTNDDNTKLKNFGQSVDGNLYLIYPL